MREKIIKAYDNAKHDIDRWFTNAARDQIARNRQDVGIHYYNERGDVYGS